MLKYLIESIMPMTGEVRFYGKEHIYINADIPYRFISDFAMRQGFRSHYSAENSKDLMPGQMKSVIPIDI